MENELYFPIFIPIKGKKVVIYGGGKIASRRVDTLLQFGADVYVIAPCLEEKLQNSESITWISESYQPGSIEKDAFLVLATTNNHEVNEAIYNECKAKNIMVNNASKKEQCDFFFPAIIKEGQMVAGLSASGSDHKLTRKVAARLREIFGQIIKESNES
jgi:siroheme synthase-like protein